MPDQADVVEDTWAGKLVVLSKPEVVAALKALDGDFPNK